MEACSPGTVGGHFPAEGSGGPPDTSSELSTVSFLSLHRRKLHTKVSCAEFEKHQRCVSPSVSGGRRSVSRKHVRTHTQTHTHVALGQRSGRNTATQGPLIQQPCHTHIHISTNTHFSIPSLFPPCLLLCLSLFSLAFSHSSADAFLLLAAGLHHTLAASLPRMNPCLFLWLSHTEHASPLISPTLVCVC